MIAIPEQGIVPPCRQLSGAGALLGAGEVRSASASLSSAGQGGKDSDLAALAGNRTPACERSAVGPVREHGRGFLWPVAATAFRPALDGPRARASWPRTTDGAGRRRMLTESGNWGE